jgi:hypothetical protein
VWLQVYAFTTYKIYTNFHVIFPNRFNMHCLPYRYHIDGDEEEE